VTNPKSEKLPSHWTAIVVFDIDGVVRDVSGSYRRAIADTVAHFTGGDYRPSPAEIDQLKSEGIWNNDWEASQELIYRYFEAQGWVRAGVSSSDKKGTITINYDSLVAFFQSRYRGLDQENWTGYICNEPLLLEPSYLESLTSAKIPWGFFSGATRGSANYVLERRLGLSHPVLIAMEDAPGKPNPTGLLATVEQLEHRYQIDLEVPVIYVGDTVADMYTVEQAKTLYPRRSWLGVGVLPPHVQETAERRHAYEELLKQAGATVVFSNVQQLTPEQIQQLVIR
jgi:HAD superfamily phosphatase